MPAATPEHVLHVVNGASGGAAQSVRILIAGLRQKGISSSVVCHDAGSATDRQALAACVDGRVVFTTLYWWNKKVRAQAYKRPLLELRQVLKTAAALRSTQAVMAAARRFSATLIHTNNLLTPEGALAARLLGLPHVWHARELVGDGHPFRLRVEGRAFGRVLAALSDVVVANSTAMSTCLTPWLPQDFPLRVVNNGVELAPFAALFLASSRARTAPLRIGMVANLASRVKRHDVFIDAAALVAQRVPDVQFVIVGEAPRDAYVDGLRARIEACGLGDRLTLVGAARTPVDAMEHVDVLVHPCGEESFGRVVVEAMASGRPVVGAAGGGILDIIEDEVSGLLAQPENPEHFAEQMNRLIHDDVLFRRLQIQGHARVEQRFSADATTNGVLAAYALAHARKGKR